MAKERPVTAGGATADTRGREATPPHPHVGRTPPSPPAPGPRRPATGGPTDPRPIASPFLTDPAAPATGPATPAAGPTAPAAGQAAPAAGPTAPATDQPAPAAHPAGPAEPAPPPAAGATAPAPAAGPPANPAPPPTPDAITTPTRDPVTTPTQDAAQPAPDTAQPAPDAAQPAPNGAQPAPPAPNAAPPAPDANTTPDPDEPADADRPPAQDQTADAARRPAPHPPVDTAQPPPATVQPLAATAQPPAARADVDEAPGKRTAAERPDLPRNDTQPITPEPHADQRDAPTRGVAKVPAPRPPWPGLQLQPMVHVADMPAAVAFYEKLGGDLVHGDRDDDWVLMQVGTTQIGLVTRPPDPARGESTVELNFSATMPLDRLERLLRERDVRIVRMAVDPDLGTRLHVETPDGMPIKIHQVEPDLLV